MFVFHTFETASTPPLEYLPVSAMKPEIGMALTMEGGQLVKASGSTVPTYICMTKRDQACDAGENIAVARVQHGITFATTFSTDAAAVQLGDKLTIADDGLQVTATTASGVAEVVKMEGTAAGCAVYIRF